MLKPKAGEWVIEKLKLYPNLPNPGILQFARTANEH